MSVIESVEETDAPFLRRTAIITALWLALFTVIAIILLIFQEPVRNLFFG